MKVIILPGYSPRNKEWAYEIKEELEPNHEVIVHEWKHWREGSFSLKGELNAIGKKIAKDKVGIIAKSVGTRVCMNLIPQSNDLIEKIILCGIPVKGDSKTAKDIYSFGLSNMDSSKVVVFQNTKDPFADFNEIRKFIGSINKNIKVIEKPRRDHHYPYSDDFIGYLG